MGKTVTATVTASDVNDLLIALRGAISFKCGSRKFKAKVATLERELRNAYNKDAEALTKKSEQFSRKVDLARGFAQSQQKPFFLTDDIAIMQEEMLDLQRDLNKNEIKIYSPLIKESELPSEEETNEEKEYNYSSIEPNGNTKYLVFSPNTIIGLLYGVLIETQTEE